MKIKEESASLEKLISGSPSDITGNVPDDVPELQLAPTMDIDFLELKDQCDIEARAMILNSVSFSIPEDMLEGNEYIKNKLEVDTMSLSGMIYQLRCNEAMQKAIMEEVKRGAVHPRNFEVFSGMSKTIGDLNKQLLQTVEAIRSTYKEIKRDITEKRTEALGPRQESGSGVLTTGDGGVVAYGSKELIREAKKRNNIENAKIVPPEIEEVKE